MQHITKISVGIVLVAILALMGGEGVHCYSCGLHRQCMASAVHVRLMYPYDWHAQSVQSSTVGQSGVIITSPDKSTFVALGLMYPITEQPNGLSEERSMII